MRFKSSWPAVSGIIYGADYNPEQWDRSVWDEDVKLMRQAGVNLVSIGIFSWSVIQPTEDTWDFAWLDEIFDILHANGIAIDLGTATASPPPWLTTKHPEILMVNELGDTIWPGARQHWRPTSPVYLRYALQLVNRLAERYGDHPALVAWHVNNELGNHNQFDFSEDAIRSFRDFLRIKYKKSLQTLNSAWETAFWSQRYSDFDEILPPRTFPRGTFLNPTHVLDWRRYTNQALVEYYKQERDLLRSITPDIPITTNLIIMGKQTKDRDYTTWVDEMDFVSNDHYVFISEQGRDELSFSASLTSGVSSHKPWLLMEHSTSAVQWQRVNSPKWTNELSRDSLTHLAHGADGLCFFQWRQSKAGAETYHSSMVPHAGPDSRLFRDVVELGALVKKLAPIKGSRKEPSKVAILFDWESWWVAEGKAQPSQIIEYQQEALDWFIALLNAGITADIIPASQLDRLSNYPLVVAPMLHVVPNSLKSKITAYVEQGGHFVTTYWSGITNENCHVHLGGYPGAFREILGIRVEELAPVASPVKLDDGTEGTIWTEPIDIVDDDVEILLRYTTGMFPGGPAVTRRNAKKGSATYVSTKLSREGLGNLLPNLLEKSGARSTLPKALCGKVEQVFRADKQTRWEFLINRTDEEISLKGTKGEFVVATGGACQDQLSARGVAIYRYDIE
jgi:beta-galactosidase